MAMEPGWECCLCRWVMATNSLPEDVNGDGVVNVSDLLAVIAAWGATSP